MTVYRTLPMRSLTIFHKVPQEQKRRKGAGMECSEMMKITFFSVTPLRFVPAFVYLDTLIRRRIAILPKLARNYSCTLPRITDKTKISVKIGKLSGHGKQDRKIRKDQGMCEHIIPNLLPLPIFCANFSADYGIRNSKCFLGTPTFPLSKRSLHL